MKYNIIRIFILLIMLGGGTLMSQMASAAVAICPTSPALPIVQPLSSLAVLSSLPIGSVIPGSDKTFSFTGNCAPNQAGTGVGPGDPIITCYYGTGAAVAGMAGVYASGVPGVGIAVENSSGQRITSASGWACNSSATPIGRLGSDANRSFSVSLKLMLIKTAQNISAGTISQAQTQWGLGVFHNGSPSGVSLSNPTYPTISYSGNVAVKTIACTVPPSLNFPMGNISLAAFSGVGSVAAAQTVNLPVTCNNTVAVSINMTSNSYVNQSLGVMNITNTAGAATGVGVQMFFNDTPINFGTDLLTGSITTANGTLNIPLTAKYYQTGPTITAGSANATATVNMIYN